MDSLGAFPPQKAQSLTHLLDMLRDQSPEVRGAAVLALAKVDGTAKQVLDALEPFKDDKEHVIRVDYAAALGELGKADASHVPDLILGLESKREALADSVEHTLIKMGQAQPDQVVPSLVEAAEKNAEPLTANVLRVMKRIGPKAPEVLPKLAELYPKCDPRLRPLLLEVVVSLDRQGDTALPLLALGLKDKEVRTRQEALLWLNRYSQRVHEIMDSIVDCLYDPMMRNRKLALNVIRTMGNRGEKAVPHLLKLAKDKDIGIRIQVIDLLGAFYPAPEGVLETLGEALKDPQREVKSRALRSLQRVGTNNPEPVIKVLAKALAGEEDPAVKAEIENALRFLQDRAVRLALDGKSDSDTKKPDASAPPPAK